MTEAFLGGILGALFATLFVSWSGYQHRKRRDRQRLKRELSFLTDEQRADWARHCKARNLNDGLTP